jgi:hypothetical protein
LRGDLFFIVIVFSEGGEIHIFLINLMNMLKVLQFINFFIDLVLFCLSKQIHRVLLKLTKHVHLSVPINAAALLHGEFPLLDLKSVIIFVALPAVQIRKLLGHFDFIDGVDSFSLANSFKTLK